MCVSCVLNGNDRNGRSEAMEGIVALLWPARSHNCSKSFSHKKNGRAQTWRKCRGARVWWHEMVADFTSEVNCRRFIVIPPALTALVAAFHSMTCIRVLCGGVCVCDRLWMSSGEHDNKLRRKNGANTFAEWHKKCFVSERRESTITRLPFAMHGKHCEFARWEEEQKTPELCPLLTKLKLKAKPKANNSSSSLFPSVYR